MKRLLKPVVPRSLLTLPVLLVVVGLPAVAPAIALPPLPHAGPERALVESWRARQQQVSEIESRFRGTLEGSSLAQLGKVAFILEQSAELPRGLLDRYDHDFVFSAVEGQRDDELETNLPAIVAYIRLTLAAKLYLSSSRARQPLVGTPAGRETIVGIAKAVHEFRSQQLTRVRAGALDPAQVLTRLNLGQLGEAATFERLRTAHREGQQQFTTQRNLVGVAAFAFQLQVGFMIAMLIRRKNGNTYLFISRPAPRHV